MFVVSHMVLNTLAAGLLYLFEYNVHLYITHTLNFLIENW